MKPVSTAAACFVLFIAPELAAGAPTGAHSYGVWGSDTFTIGADDIRSSVSYRGNEVLTVTRRGRGTRLSARVVYTRDDEAGASPDTGEYVVDLSPSGETVATADRDPDSLTVLNQPFAARLERGTLHDLERLGGPLPFDFPSPFTRSSLHGYLIHLGGPRGGRGVVGVRFEAAGAMRGALPDQPGWTLTGTIAMSGTAFYDTASDILRSLATTVTVSGTVSDRSRRDHVKIVYTRTMQADSPVRRPQR